MTTATHLIQDAAALSQLANAIEQAPRVALDTEFHAERRRHPELMLVQIATAPDTVWMLDPKAVHPAPLADMLSGKPLLIHGGKHDIQILHELTGFKPTAIFDTQVGAGLLGGHYPERLSTLMRTWVNQPLDKSATLTDWSRRPLSKAQLDYAAEDVANLFALVDALVVQLQAVNRQDLAWTASLEQCQQWLNPVADVAYWLQWDVASRMAEDEWQTLGVLRTWRSALAKKQNRPDHAVLPNTILIDLARRQPSNRQGLSANRRIHSNFIRQHGNALLDTIRVATTQPPVPKPPSMQQKQCAAALQIWAHAIGAQDRIAPTLLLPPHVAVDVAVNGPSALQGWRSLWQQPIKCFLSGGSFLQVVSTDSESSTKIVVVSPAEMGEGFHPSK